jgi:hypothetical protein
MIKIKHVLDQLRNSSRGRKAAQQISTRPRVEPLESRCLLTAFFFSTGNPDALMAAATRPATSGKFEIETADDFVLTSETHIDHATFTGLQPATATATLVSVEIYRVFPLDSNVGRTSGPPTFSTPEVPTRVNSPSDVVFTFRDTDVGNLVFTTTVLAPTFTALNSVAPGGIHPKPGQTTGGNGPVSGEEVQYSVTFTAPLDLPAGHYFFVPQIAVDTGDFFWLSAPRPIVPPGTPFPVGFTDLQSWTRDFALDPDWLRIGTDIVGGATPPTFNGTFTLSGVVVQPLIAVGADAGGGPEVKAYDGVTGALRLDFYAYEPSFTGGVRVAVADYNGDGVLDVITAPGPGRAPEVRIFDGQSGAEIAHFDAYDSRFLGGVFVTAANLISGNVVGPGVRAVIITGPDFSGGPDVRGFLTASNTPSFEFMAYDPRYTGGVRVAAADFNGDGFPDIVTAPGTFSGPDIRIYDPMAQAQIGEFLAYDIHYSGGVFVATGDTNHDGTPDIITGPGGSSGPEVKSFNGKEVLGNASPAKLLDFYAYDSAFGGGARVAVLDTNGDGFADIVTGAGPGGGPHVRIFSGRDGVQLPNPQDSFFAFDPHFAGGVFVGGQ